MIIDQAERFCNHTVTANLDNEPELCREAAKMLPGLVAECKRLDASLKAARLTAINRRNIQAAGEYECWKHYVDTVLRPRWEAGQ